MIVDVEDAAIAGEGAEILFHGLSMSLAKGQVLGLFGPNGSGKSVVLGALAGRLDFVKGRIHRIPARGTLAEVSFSEQERILGAEYQADDSDFMEGGVDHGTTVAAFLAGLELHGGRAGEVFRALGLSALLSRGIKYLSSGEFRKILLFRALFSACEVCALVEPREALDSESSSLVQAILDDYLHEPGAGVLVVCEEASSFPPQVGKALEFCQGRQGPVLQKQAGLWPITGQFSASSHHSLASLESLCELPSASTQEPPQVLLAFRKVTVRYDGESILEDLDFSLKRGEHTMIQGPNGCGKTTMLKLISGDHPQVYANDIEVCGFRRGQGESIWDVKARMGILSSAFHLEWLRVADCQALEVLASGIHGTIGIYQQVSDYEKQKGLAVLDNLGLKHLAERSFKTLSWGEQRSLLLARALMKSPWLLLLDEPCHGLDKEHRQLVLEVAELAAQQLGSTLVHVSHDLSELLPSTRKIVRFKAVDGKFWPSGRPHYQTCEEKLHGLS